MKTNQTFEQSTQSVSPVQADSTRVRILTARAPAAIAVIQLEGPASRALIDFFWMPAISKRSIEINAIRYGSWHSHGGEELGLESDQASEDIVLCWTKPDRVEVHCHGGPVAANRILRDLTSRGAIHDDASTNPRGNSVYDQNMIDDADTVQLDRWTEAAWLDLPFATTELTTAIMLDQATGKLEEAMRLILKQIASGDTSTATRTLEHLELRSNYGMRLVSAWRVAIVGPPNAGKSSFLNRVLGYKRAIVHDSPGTTRDVLRERTSILGWPIEFIDTAGLRNTTCHVEAEGVRRALDVLQESDLILLLIEPMEGIVDLHLRIINDYQSKTIAVLTKADLGTPEIKTAVQNRFDRSLKPIAISSSTNFQIDMLFEEIIARLVPDDFSLGQAVPFRVEQIRFIQKLKSTIKTRDS